MAVDAGGGQVTAAPRLAAALLVWALAPAVSLAQPETSNRGESAAPAPVARVLIAPVDLVVWNRRLATFRAPFGALFPAERARGARRRIEALPLDHLDDQVELLDTTSGDLHGVLVAVGGSTLFGLLDADVDPSAGQTLQSAAEEAKGKLLEVFAARLEQHRPATILRAVAAALAGALVLVAVCFVDLRARRRVKLYLDRLVPSLSQRVVGIDLRPVVFATGRLVLDATAWAIRAFVFYVALAVVLRQLPYTRPWGERLGLFLEGILRELGSHAVDALPGLLVTLIVFVLAHLTSRAADRMFDAAARGTFSVTWLNAATIPATRRIVRIVIWLFALTVAYPHLPGSETAAFKGISVLAGAMLTLGSSGLMTQLMSGLVLIYSRALKPGDLVHVGDTLGFVIDIGFLSTQLRTPRAELITIPNAVMIGKQVTNYDEDALIPATVTIGYDVPWRRVHDLLLLAAERTPGLRSQPPPYIVQRSLSQFYAEYELRVRPERFEQRMKTLSALNAQIQDLFNEHGVQIMTPQFESQPDQPVVAPRASWKERLTAGPDPSKTDEAR